MPETTSAEDDDEAEGVKINLSPHEEHEAEERAPPSAAVVFATISTRGYEELKRPLSGMWWSGVSAGVVLSTSVVAEGLFHHVLPPFAGRNAISDIGYSLGFVMVILGRMQLFTENTITPVLPLLTNPTRLAFWRLGRLWLVVLVANLVGAFLAALLLSHGEVITPEQQAAMIEVSSKITDNTSLETLRYGIPAGFFMAALVWMMPTSRGSEFWVILSITYLIALGDFTHVIAGAAEAFLLLLTGHVTVGFVAFNFLLPALVGNVFGGTVIFAVLAFAQVREEIGQEKYRDHDPFAPMKRKRRRRRTGQSRER